MKFGIPDRPGYYWRKLSDGKTEVVRVYSRQTGLFCDYYRESFPVTGFHKGTKFYGPIEEPYWESDDKARQAESQSKQP